MKTIRESVWNSVVNSVHHAVMIYVNRCVAERTGITSIWDPICHPVRLPAVNTIGRSLHVPVFWKSREFTNENN